MAWKVAYVIPGDDVPTEEFFESEEKAQDFANRARLAGWYIITIEEVRA